MSTARKPSVVGLIPIRLESTRLPRKGLADICGLPMIVHVLRRSQMAKSLDEVYVVTDSLEVKEVVEKHGGKVLMTSSAHETGTDRIAEAAAKLDFDIVVNIQGDEALLKPEHIDLVVEGMSSDPTVDIALLVNPFDKYNSPSDIKVVLNDRDDIMYFSRSDIPSPARTANPPMLKAYHIVPFRKEFLLQFASWPKGDLEQIEFIEYMRILEKGHSIRAIRVDSSAVSVDTENDLAFVRSKMPEDPVFASYFH